MTAVAEHRAPNGGQNPHAIHAQDRDGIEHRRILVAELMLARRTQRQMVEDLAKQNITVSLATINADVAAVREQWRARSAENYGTFVMEQIAQLDALEATFMPKARAGNDGAAKRVLAIMARKARLLGLDAPQRMEHTGAEGGPILLAAEDARTKALRLVHERREQQAIDA